MCMQLAHVTLSLQSLETHINNQEHFLLLNERLGERPVMETAHMEILFKPLSGM